jgi:CheY-like chemotaxis protein
VLVNLIANGVKFTEAGRVAIRADEADGRVTIAIADTGIGIAPDAHELIFEPFRQVNPGTVLGSRGTGLGLAICQRLVQLMGGRIWVESEPGAGSTFFVSLPVAQIRAVEALSLAPDAATCDVVVVGDPARTRPLIASLRSRGLEAVNVSGPTALQELTAAAPRLVLFDVFLQHAAAWRHLAALRAAPKHRDRRVGLFGLADGGGRLVVPTDLDVLADENLEAVLAGRMQALCPDVGGRGAPGHGRVLVVGADITWRRRVSLILEARGIRVAEATHADEVFSVARRLHIRGIVAELLLPDPGIAELLTRLNREESTFGVPVLLVGPSALSPGQQRDLRRELGRWSREWPAPVSELAGCVASVVGDCAHEVVRGAGVGEGAWRAH